MLHTYGLINESLYNYFIFSEEINDDDDGSGGDGSGGGGGGGGGGNVPSNTDSSIKDKDILEQAKSIDIGKKLKELADAEGKGLK
ncbi:MAG: hypothetical protein QM484_11405 [Woeseiaceae bacterium]